MHRIAALRVGIVLSVGIVAAFGVAAATSWDNEIVCMELLGNHQPANPAGPVILHMEPNERRSDFHNLAEPAKTIKFLLNP